MKWITTPSGFFITASLVFHDEMMIEAEAVESVAICTFSFTFDRLYIDLSLKWSGWICDMFVLRP